MKITKYLFDTIQNLNNEPEYKDLTLSQLCDKLNERLKLKEEKELKTVQLVIDTFIDKYFIWYNTRFGQNETYVVHFTKFIEHYKDIDNTIYYKFECERINIKTLNIRTFDFSISDRDGADFVLTTKEKFEEIKKFARDTQKQIKYILNNIKAS